MHDVDGNLELLSRYIDGVASPQEVAALAQWIGDTPAGAEALAELCRLDAWLLERFQTDQAAARAGALLARSAAPKQARRTSSRSVLWLSVAAAVVSAVTLWAVVPHWVAPRSPSPVTAEVAAGQLAVGGRSVIQLRSGDEASVVGDSPATVLLAGGSRITLEPGSVAGFSSPAKPRRHVVSLRDGKADVEVDKGGGTFEVQTPLGKVTALGTAFSVELLAHAPYEEGVETMKLKHAVLAVAVLSGTVQVDLGGRCWQLGPGDSSLFAKEAGRNPKINSVTGLLTKLDAASLTLTPDKSEKTRDVSLDAGTKVLIETDEMEAVRGKGDKIVEQPKLREAALADLKAGQRVTVQYGDDGKAVKVIVLRARPAGGKDDWQKASTFSGELTRVEGDKLTVARKGDQGQQVRQITLGSAAKIGIETDQMETVQGKGGKTYERPKVQDGAVSDLTVGKHITVTAGAEGKAIEILINRAKPLVKPEEPPVKQPPAKSAGEVGGETGKKGKAEPSTQGAGTK